MPGRCNPVLLSRRLIYGIKIWAVYRRQALPRRVRMRKDWMLGWQTEQNGLFSKIFRRAARWGGTFWCRNGWWNYLLPIQTKGFQIIPFWGGKTGLRPCFWTGCQTVPTCPIIPISSCQTVKLSPCAGFVPSKQLTNVIKLSLNFWLSYPLASPREHCAL